MMSLLGFSVNHQTVQNFCPSTQLMSRDYIRKILATEIILQFFSVHCSKISHLYWFYDQLLSAWLSLTLLARIGWTNNECDYRLQVVTEYRHEVEIV